MISIDYESFLSVKVYIILAFKFNDFFYVKKRKTVMFEHRTS